MNTEQTQSKPADGRSDSNVGLGAAEFGGRISLAGMTEKDKKQIMKMLHVQGEFDDYNINTTPIGILRAMAHAIRYGRIQGANVD